MKARLGRGARIIAPEEEKGHDTPAGADPLTARSSNEQACPGCRLVRKRLSSLQLSAIVKFSLGAVSTSVRVVETDWVVFVEAAVAGDASCKMCLSVAFTFPQAAVKSPALAGVGGSEEAFLLVTSNSFHCNILGHSHQWLGFLFILPIAFRLLLFELLLNRLGQAS